MSNVANITLDDASPLFVYSGVWNTDQSGGTLSYVPKGTCGN